MPPSVQRCAPRLTRETGLRAMLELLVMAGEEAPCRDSGGELRHAAASVANAMAIERRRPLQ